MPGEESNWIRNIKNKTASILWLKLKPSSNTEGEYLSETVWGNYIYYMLYCYVCYVNYYKF